MTNPRRPFVPLLPLVLGVTDGMLNALTLSSATILKGGGALELSLAFRVGVAALVTAAFTMFVADYADRRSSLVRASRELNLTRAGHLATTKLGAQALRESMLAMVVAAISSFGGAVLPLLVGVLAPQATWIVLALTVACLGGLGWALGKLVSARPARWAIGMLVGGIIVTAVGLELRIT